MHSTIGQVEALHNDVLFGEAQWPWQLDQLPMKKFKLEKRKLETKPALGIDEI